jgi:solute:Na+ symporter, SSS family
MHIVDWFVLLIYFLLLLSIGLWAYRKVKNSSDFFTAGGKLPWWLSGVSHHISGYSGAVFVAYAGIAYTHGFTVYIWWALAVATATFAGAQLIAPRWARLRIAAGIQSPTEFLLNRYNLTTQQIIAWSGVIIKIFDVGAKWAAIAVLLNIFAGTPFITGIILAGSISIIYSTLGGLWADVANDFAQFLVQLAAGITMFVIVLSKLGDGASGILSLWDKLPATHSQLFNDPYTWTFFIVMMIIDFFSYSGGTWHLATRFIASSSGKEAKKAATLSSILYLLWPLILFFPMFSAPLFIPGLEEPTRSYGLLALKFLPAGLIGLVLAALFTNTLSMTSSDANTISAVITRDILPCFIKEYNRLDKKEHLLIARISTFSFTLLTIIIAINATHFGGVFGLIVSWFAALLGPIAIPMILGLLPAFRKCDSKIAIASIISGISAFIILKFFHGIPLALEVGTPLFTSLTIYIVAGLCNKREVPARVDELFLTLQKEQ